MVSLKLFRCHSLSGFARYRFDISNGCARTASINFNHSLILFHSALLGVTESAAFLESRLEHDKYCIAPGLRILYLSSGWEAMKLYFEQLINSQTISIIMRRMQHRNRACEFCSKCRRQLGYVFHSACHGLDKPLNFMLFSQKI